VSGEIRAPLPRRGPARPHQEGEAAQLIAHGDAAGRAVPAFVVEPALLLDAGEGSPVAGGKLTEGSGVAHGQEDSAAAARSSSRTLLIARSALIVFCGSMATRHDERKAAALRRYREERPSFKRVRELYFYFYLAHVIDESFLLPRDRMDEARAEGDTGTRARGGGLGHGRRGDGGAEARHAQSTRWRGDSVPTWCWGSGTGGVLFTMSR